MTEQRVKLELPPSKDFLRIADLDWRQLQDLLALSSEMKAAPHGWVDSFRGRSVASFFVKPSTRTRVSIEAAAHRLGLLPIMLRPGDLQLGRGEPLRDTARALGGYCAAIVMRVFEHRELDVVAESVEVPVVNALSDQHHPCQALADLLTLKEHFGRLERLRVAYVGDANNVANSLIEACALAGVELRIGCPPEYAPDPIVETYGRYTGLTTGATLLVTDDPSEAVAGAHAVFTDAWVSMGDELEHARRLKTLRRFQVNQSLMSLADDQAVFLHCLPAHRGEEATADVIDGARSLVWQQAANRLCTEQAVLATLIKRSDRSPEAGGETFAAA